jgi:hypothetical protein
MIRTVWTVYRLAALRSKPVFGGKKGKKKSNMTTILRIAVHGKKSK